MRTIISQTIHCLDYDGLSTLFYLLDGVHGHTKFSPILNHKDSNMSRQC